MAEDNRRMARGIGAQSFHSPERRLPGRSRRSFLVLGAVGFLAATYMFLTVSAHPPVEAVSSPAVAPAMIALAEPAPGVAAAESGTLASVPAQGEPLHEVPYFAPQPLDPAVFPLGIKKVILDPGHGGDDLGAVGSSGIAEKEITLDIALRLRRLMEHARFEVLLTRKTDEKLALAQRADFANSSGADIFISIHVNSLNIPRLRTVETYYLGPTKNPLSIQLASVENRESGYSLGDYRRLLEKIYLDVRRDESHKLAEVIHRELYYSMSQINGLLENRGIKTAPFIVLVATEMPAILVEVSCLSNEEEARQLASPDYREKIAEALFRGIHSYAATLNGSNRKGS